MKLRTWGWISIPIVVISALILGAYFYFSSGDEVEFVVDEVKRGDLVQSVDATGSLQSLDQVDLSFETAGTIDSIFVKEGESVEIGQVLAELKAEDLKAEVRKAEQSLAIASAKLSQEIAGASNESVAVLMASVSIAEANLTAALVDLENTKITTKISKEESVVTLEKQTDNYENVVAVNEFDLVEANEDFIGSMKFVMIEVRAGLSNADEVLGVENTILNDGFEKILKSQGASRFTAAANDFELAVKSRDSAELLVFALSASSEKFEIDVALSAVEDAMYDASITLLHTRQVLDITTLDTADFTLAELIALKTKIDTARGALQTKEGTFFTEKQAFETSSINAKTDEDTARHALSLAELDLQKAQSNEDSNVASASALVMLREADLEKANASLSEIEADPRSVDLAAFKADVARTKADLDASNARLKKAQIISPIAGRLTNIGVEVGEQVSVADKLVTVQTTEDDQFKVVLDVSEADVAKINVGDPVRIVFDAFGDDSPVFASIGVIDPAQKVIEGVVFYQSDVFFRETEIGLEVRPGMSVDTIITTAEVINTLFIPQRSVLEREDGQKYVRIQKGKSFVERDVTVGLRADGGKLQILEGLEEGETIIVTIR